MAKYIQAAHSRYNPDAPSRRLKRGRRKTVDATIYNDNHGTQYTMRVKWYQPLSDTQIAQCRQTLCPAGCNCGGRLKERGPQDVRINVVIGLHNKQVITLEPIRGKLD